MPKSAATISKLGGTFPYILTTRFENSNELFPYVADTFSRADNASSVGSTELAVGMVANAWTAYTVSGGTAAAFGILSGKLYVSTLNGDTDLVVDSGATDGAMSITVSTASSGTGGAEVGLVFRHARTNSGSHYLFIWRGSGTGNANTVECYKNVGSTYTSLGANTAPATLASGDVLTVIWSGSNMAMYKNGVLGLAVTDTSITTGTGVGYRSNASTLSLPNRLDNFQCYQVQASAVGQLTLPATLPTPLMSRSSLTKPVYAVTPVVNMASGSPQAPIVECSLDSGLSWQTLTNKARNYLGAIATSIRFRLTNQSSTLVDTFARPGKSRGIYDTFGRALSGSLGTGDSGQVWQYTSGAQTFFNVASGYAYMSSFSTNANTFAYFDTALSTLSGSLAGFNTYDYTVTVTNTSANSAELLFRIQDSTNYLRVIIDGSAGTVALAKVVAGSGTTLNTVTAVATGTSTWRISVTPTSISVYQNGSLIIGPVLNTDFNTSTLVGFWTFSASTGSATQYSNLSVTTTSYTARTALEIFSSPFITSSGHRMYVPTLGPYITPAGYLRTPTTTQTTYMYVNLGGYDRDVSMTYQSNNGDTSGNNEAGIFLRQQDGTNFTYMYFSAASNAVGVGMLVNNVFSAVIAGVAQGPAGTVWRCTVVGNVYTLYKNGVSQGSGTTANFATSTTNILLKVVTMSISNITFGPHPLPMTLEDASFLLETQT